ncbi:MAG: DUF2891 domain-containing protein [Halobacteria archaeon]|nr:DUF2891 domain-containing protein [Halobacteria archaeon]
MNLLDVTDVKTVLSGKTDWIESDVLEKLSRDPLDCIETEFPHSVYSIEDPDDIERPKDQHPVFYGCFDWHSSVHSHWSLIRQLRLFDDHPTEPEIVESLEDRFTRENVEQEVEYLEENESFEKPYGWAWFLRLASELSLWEDDRAEEWRNILKPLEDRIVDLVGNEFLSQNRPFRVGTHQNSAFALGCVLDYARVTSNETLESSILETSRRFYIDDKDYPVEYEPLGWDFVSPSLTEADLMRRVLDRDEFTNWIDGFLPDVTESPYDAIMDPIEVGSDEGIELHLVGLNLSKAWCMAGIASALDDHRYADAFEESAARHAEHGIKKAFPEDYAGTHWLSSFVLYLLTRNEGAIAPE